MTKQELRKTYYQKRLALKDAEYEQLSKLLCETFFKAIDVSSVDVLHSFLPIAKNREPNTWLIIKEVQLTYPDVKISIPKINHEDNMESYYLDESKLELNAWGIPEPVEGTITDPSSIDMILVPLLAFDNEGHRVGYGKGYYDRFLKDCRKDARKIGLSFFPPEEKIVDTFSEDFRLDMAITPGKAYEFER